MLGRLNRDLRSVFYLHGASAQDVTQLFPMSGCAGVAGNEAGHELRTTALRAPGVDVSQRSNVTLRKRRMLDYPRERLRSCVRDCARVERCEAVRISTLQAGGEV